MPDDQDYADLAGALARAEHWSDAEASDARALRESQARAAAAFDQRDRQRVAAMWTVVREIDEALDRWERSR